MVLRTTCTFVLKKKSHFSFLALRIEIAIENSTGANARWSVVPEPNLSGSKFLHRADASDVDPKAIGFAANEFLVT